MISPCNSVAMTITSNQMVEIFLFQTFYLTVAVVHFAQANSIDMSYSNVALG